MNIYNKLRYLDVVVLHAVFLFLLIQGSSSECPPQDPQLQYLPCVYPGTDEADCLPEVQRIDTTDNSSEDGDKISGGTEVVSGSAPWVVGLYDLTYSSPKYFCSGVIVANKWVLTSAQCVQAYSESDIKVIVGDHDITVLEGHEELLFVTQIIKHHNYDPYNMKNDLALLRVFPEIRYTHYVRNIKLDNVFTSFEQEECTIFGWGAMQNGGHFSSVLMEAPVTVYVKDDCKEVYPGLLSTTMICVGTFDIESRSNSGPCQGDWGGPLVCRDKELGGIASWSNGCGYEGYPAVYTSAPAYYLWILQHIGNHHDHHQQHLNRHHEELVDHDKRDLDNS